MCKDLSVRTFGYNFDIIPTSHTNTLLIDKQLFAFLFLTYQDAYELILKAVEDAFRRECYDLFISLPDKELIAA